MIGSLIKQRKLGDGIRAGTIQYDAAVGQLTSEDILNVRVFGVILLLMSLFGYFTMVLSVQDGEGVSKLIIVALPIFLAMAWYIFKDGHILRINRKGGVGHMLRTSGLACLVLTIADIIFLKSMGWFLFLTLIYLPVGQLIWMVRRERR